MSNWPFSDPPSMVVLAHCTIAEEEKPVLIFGRYPDGSYCAYTGDGVVDAEIEIACVCLFHIVDLDPAVRELTDIQLGWWALHASRGHFQPAADRLH
jgi:hypothetical protein